MTDADRRFHETWLGMVQPVEGLVVSIPVLEDAQCGERQPPNVQEKLRELCPAPPGEGGEPGPRRVLDLRVFFRDLLGFSDDRLGPGGAVSLYIPETKQTIEATLALRKPGDGAGHEFLVWDIGTFPGGIGLDLDRSETITGTWDYPPSAKFDRLLRHARTPIGLLTNREVIRLVYAPHGESSGSITFRLDDMASVGGRPILDAFVMLLSANRIYGVTEDRTLAAILEASRKRQTNVTNDLADQVFEALQILLRGFEAAAERDGRALLDDALAREGDHLYKGLLTVLLRLVFVLYAEDRGLLPVDHPIYAENLSVLELFEGLQSDHGAYPDSMSRRFGAWGRLVTLFRAVFLGLSHDGLKMPPRRGSLFNPHEYPVLEGWGPGGSAPISQAEDRAQVRLPSVDDETVFLVLERLLMLGGQRLSYRALDVEQIGSVYEALMGFHVRQMVAPAVCIKPDRVWVTAEEIWEVPPSRRAKWLKDSLSMSTAQAERLAEEIAAAEGVDATFEVLSRVASGGRKKADLTLVKARAGQLVLQPGSERRRTSSHYTPRGLSTPIVRRTLKPLLAVMGEAPASERILNLKICDPAVGSGAFLVEACRYLGDEVLAAWTREGKIDAMTAARGNALLHARRLVAQRCLYGVDKNAAAVELAKLSLWLITLAKDLPFTFLDHALRHGDSLVGLDFDQIRSFHWTKAEKASKQLELFGREIAAALDEAITLRQQIGDLGDSPLDDREKARLFWDAQDALDRVRIIGDLVVGAFFSAEKDKDRELERSRREVLVRAWLLSGGPPTAEILELQREIRARIPVFHWMAEFPEIFYAERPDPLDENQVNRAAFMDGFVGNPPFAGKNNISESNGPNYLPWLQTVHEGAHGNSDLSAHFFRRTARLLGEHGTIGLIATNTIAQGDTRATGLQVLVEGGAEIYEAIESMMWPGEAAVSVSVVHLALGNAVRAVGERRLNGKVALGINSQLGAGAERGDAVKLGSNAELSFQGSNVLGKGFILTPEERAALVAKDARNAERTFPYLGGQEVNSTETQTFERYVINFGWMSLEEAGAQPDLVAILRERVKPERDRLKDNVDGREYKQNWWRFAKSRRGLLTAIAPLKRCLVNSQVSKHLVFAFQPTDRVFAHTLYVFALDSFAAFATLQSRIHEKWARLLSSSMKNDLRYAASDCFETFPFPKPDPRTPIPALELIGQRLYDLRAKYMADEAKVGLTITYNRLKDPASTEPRILELRALHEDLDRQVLAAYAESDPAGRWQTIEVPPFCPMTDADRQKLERFESEVIDRLFALNAKRAEEERRRGLGGKAKKPKMGKTKSPAKRPKDKQDKSQRQLRIESKD